MEVLDNYGLILINQSPGEEKQALGGITKGSLKHPMFGQIERQPPSNSC